jgi:hypothetical protein
VRGQRVDLAQEGRARGVEDGAELDQDGHEFGAELQGHVQRCPVVLGACAEIRPGADQDAHDVGPALGDGDVQRRPATLPGPFDGAAEQPGGRLDGGPDRVHVPGGDEPAQPLGGHASGHASSFALGVGRR